METVRLGYPYHYVSRSKLKQVDQLFKNAWSNFFPTTQIGIQDEEESLSRHLLCPSPLPISSTAESVVVSLGHLHLGNSSCSRCFITHLNKTKTNTIFLSQSLFPVDFTSKLTEYLHKSSNC